MTLMMTSAQVVETSVNVTNNSPSRDYSHPDDQTTQTTETPGFKPFTIKKTEKSHIPTLNILSVLVSTREVSTELSGVMFVYLVLNRLIINWVCTAWPVRQQ